MKTKSGPSSSSTSRSHHLNFKEEPMVTNSDEEEEDDDDEVDGANSLSKAELDRLVEEHLRSDDTQTAAFWAEKRLAIDGGRTLNERLPQIAQYLAVLTAARSWQTIITMIERHCLFTKHMAFAFFNVNALFNRELFSEIIALPIGYLCHWDEVPFITPDSASYLCAESDAVREPTIKAKLDEFVRERKYEARLLFLLSKTYLMVQNRPAAAGCLRHCLNSNPYCSEALHLAIDSRLLRANELQEIVSSSQAAGNATGTRVISHLLEIYDLTREPSSFTMDSPKLSQMLGSDLSFQSATAFRLYSQGCVQQAYKITSTIMHEFGYYSKCFLVHVGCLVHLNKVSELYQLGHTMVKLQPEREITWYAVGCYYYATGQYTTAKKFLNKCTLMNSGFGEGWLAYGHTLFYVEEHEQAMNCYLRASRILEGHFEPLLNIAVEYCFANNLKLATDFLHDAEMVAAGANAIVLHEQGTVAYMQHNLERAEQIMMEALRLITHRDVAEPLEHLMSTEISEFWEPLFNNLGHTLRKQGKYEQAILVHRKALLLGTSKADTWACIGVCYACLVSECVDTNTTNGDESGSSPTTNTATGVDDKQQQQPAKTGPTVSTCVDAGMEALNKALALRPGDDLVKLALEKLTKFASDRTLQERFTLLDTTPDENLDTMVEERKRQQQQQQGCCSSSSLQNSGRRSRKVLGKGLDMVDPNTSGEGSNTHQDNNQPFSALCSSPMTSQQAAALPSSSIF